MAENLEDNYWLEDDNPLRTSRGMAKISEETTYRTKCCWEHELDCGKDIFNELFEEILKENPDYFDSTKVLVHLLSFHPKANTPKTDLSTIYVGALIGYALQRRAEEDIREVNYPLGKKLETIRGCLDNVVGFLNDLVPDELEFDVREFESLKKLKYEIGSLAADYIEQESYCGSLEEEKKTLVEEIEDKDNHIKYLSDILEDNRKELEILRDVDEESELEKKAKDDFLEDYGF